MSQFNPQDPDCPDRGWEVFLYLLQDVPMVILVVLAFLLSIFILNTLGML